MAAFPIRDDNASRAVLAAIEHLRDAGRPVRVDTIAEVSRRTRSRTSSQVAKMRRLGMLPCEVARVPKADSAYLKVVAAAEQLEREGGALSWDRLGRVAGCTAKAAHGHAQNAKRAGVWRWTVLPKYSLMTSEERSDLWRGTRKPRNNGWTPEAEVEPMDLAVLEEIRASKVEAAKKLEVRVCKFHYYSSGGRIIR